MSPLSTSINILCRYYSAFNPCLHELTKLTTFLTLKQRSAVIKCCQAQHIPKRFDGTTLSRIVSDSNSIHFHRNECCDLYDTLESFRDIICSPASHIIIDIMRSVPFNENEQVVFAREAGWSKEISILESVPDNPPINWKAIMDPQHFHESLLPTLREPDPSLNRYLHKCLSDWKKKMTSRIHYPRTSNKVMSWSTARSLEEYYGFGNAPERCTQIDVQRLYARTGFEAGGICEVRQKWYRANAKPRTYYAQGGETWAKSSMLQEAFSELHDAFPFTHRILRLRPRRLNLKHGNRFRIYDFEGFTSRLDCQQDFVRELGLFCQDEEFSYFDGWNGLVVRNFGDMMCDYAETCTKGVEVSYERFLKGDTSVHISHHAGLLGIYGNLMTSTVAHGLVIRYLVETDEEINIAGDDGLAPENDETETELELALDLLGRIEKDKTFRSDEKGAIHLKRPFSTLDTQIVTGFNVLFPSGSRLVYLYDYQLSDIRYAEYESPVEWSKDRIWRVGRELSRFLRQVKMYSDFLREDQIEGCLRMLQFVTNLFHMKPSLPYTHRDRFWPWIPESVQELLENDHVFQLVSQNYRGYAEVPEHDSLPIELEGYTGEEKTGNMTRHIRWLIELGFVESSVRKRLLYGWDGLEALYRLFSGSRFHDVPVVYDFVVIEDIPARLLRSQ